MDAVSRYLVLDGLDVFHVVFPVGAHPVGPCQGVVVSPSVVSGTEDCHVPRLESAPVVGASYDRVVGVELNLVWTLSTYLTGCYTVSHGL